MVTNKVDDLARALRDAPANRDLSAVEALVWRRLDEDAAWAFFGPLVSPRLSLAATRLSLGAIMLMSGVFAGALVAGLVGPEFSELAVFSTNTPFGPTNLLSRS